MAAGNFMRCLPITLTWEGGFVDDPRDPGGATNKGVTQKVYNEYRDSLGSIRQSVKLMADSEMQAIYKLRYWDKIAGDKLPLGIDMALFDFAVNSGVGRAVREIQHLVGVTEDGVMGPGTLVGVLEYAQTKTPLYMAESICDDRMAFLKGLKTYQYFGKGWSRRVMGDHEGIQEGDNGVIDVAGAMCLGDPVWGPSSKLYTPKTYLAQAA